MKDINRKIAFGTAWNLLDLFISKGATTIFTVFLATFLSPKDFGLIAMLAIVFELSSVLVNSGLSQALIRTKTVTNKDLSTVFWSNLFISFVLYGAISLLSTQIANFFNEPRLTVLVPVLAIGILINGFTLVQKVILSKEMNFRSQMQASTISTLISGVVAIVMAYFGYGVWSLVTQMIVSQLIATLMLWFSTGWKPMLYFDFSAFKVFFDFSKYLIASNVLNVAFKNSYTLIIAKFFGPDIVGLYFFSSKLSLTLANKLSKALQKTSFPALATLQNNDEKLCLKYREIIQMTMFVMAPIMLMMIVLSDILFELFFDEKWRPAVDYTQLLCIVGLLYPVHYLNVNVLMVKGRSDLNLKLGIIKKIFQTAILALSIPYGVKMIVVGQVVSSILMLIPNSYYTGRFIKYTFKMQVLDIIKPISAAFMSSILVYFLLVFSEIDSFLGLCFLVLLGGLGYLFFCFVFKVESFFYLINKLKRALSK